MNMATPGNYYGACDMSERIVKAKKDYVCDNCGAEIKKGDYHISGSTRVPAYGEDGMGNDVQVGIFYEKWRLCEDYTKCFWDVSVQQT